MRKTSFLVGGMIVIFAGGWTTFSMTHGQDRAPQAPQYTPIPAAQSTSQRPNRDLAKWPFFPKQIYLSSQRGSEWLQRNNGTDGRFVTGYVPALRVALEGDSYLRQVGAAIVLAKAASYFNDEQAAAKARQAVLTLLLDTGPEDPNNPAVRVPTLPAGMANRLGAAAMLVQAVHALPAPAADLLDQADQLCNGIRKTQRSDGSLVCTVPGTDGTARPDDNEAVNLYSGEALYALVRSHHHRPTAWKLDAARAALPFYQARSRASKNTMQVPSHTAAFTEVYLLSGDKAFADYVFEMNDWLCAFQYQQLDAQHPQWLGGFMGCADGKPVPLPPQAAGGALAESLVDAARVARKVGDVQRWQRYKVTLERSLQFLITLQYTSDNSLHFADWYRPVIIGSFHASHQDGNIRLDYTDYAVSAMIGYLQYVAEVP